MAAPKSEAVTEPVVEAEAPKQATEAVVREADPEKGGESFGYGQLPA